MKIIFISYLVLFSLIEISQNDNNNNKEFEDVINTFKASIISKDSTQFNSLFFNDKVLFTGIMSKKTELSIKKDYPDFEGIATSNNRKFINDICKTPKKQEEVFYNLQSSNDNLIASISFDYGYYSDSKLLQWGHEKWNLVRVDEKWLITDVIYSIHFPDVEEFPYNDKK